MSFNIKKGRIIDAKWQYTISNCRRQFIVSKAICEPFHQYNSLSPHEVCFWLMKQIIFIVNAYTISSLLMNEKGFMWAITEEQGLKTDH